MPDVPDGVDITIDPDTGERIVYDPETGNEYLLDAPSNVGEFYGKGNSKLPSVGTKLLEEISKCGNIEIACSICGITPGTYRNWRKRGESETSGIYHQFYLDTERVKAEVFSDCVDNIKRAGEDDWKASAWVVEHLFKNEMATGSVDTVIINNGIINTPEIKSAARQLSIALRKTNKIALDDYDESEE